MGLQEGGDLRVQLAEMPDAVARLGPDFGEDRIGYRRGKRIGGGQGMDGIDFVADDKCRNVERGRVAVSDRAKIVRPLSVPCSRMSSATSAIGCMFPGAAVKIHAGLTRIRPA